MMQVATGILGRESSILGKRMSFGIVVLQMPLGLARKKTGRQMIVLELRNKFWRC